MFGVLGVAGEAGHVKSQGRFMSDSSGDTLKEDNDNWCTIFDVGSLEKVGPKPFAEIMSDLLECG